MARLIFAIFALLLIVSALGRLPDLPADIENDVNYEPPMRAAKAPKSPPAANMFALATQVIAMAMEWLNQIQDYIVENVVGTMVPMMFGKSSV